MIENLVVIVGFCVLVYYIRKLYKQERFKELSQLLIVILVIASLFYSQYLFNWIPPSDPSDYP